MKMIGIGGQVDRAWRYVRLKCERLKLRSIQADQLAGQLGQIAHLHFGRRQFGEGGIIGCQTFQTRDLCGYGIEGILEPLIMAGFL